MPGSFLQAYYLEPWMLDFVHNLLLASFQLLSPHFCFAKGIFDVAQVCMWAKGWDKKGGGGLPTNSL